MGIFDRVGKVISSNVNALLDKAEDTQKTVDQLIDDMRVQIKRGRQEVVSALAAEKQLKQKTADLNQQIDKWQKRAELAVKTGDEDLAREALKQKKRLTTECDQNEASRAEQRATALRLKDEMEQAEAKLRDLETRKATIAVRYDQAKAGGGAEALGAKGTGPTPFDELRRIEDKMDRQQTEGEAMKEAKAVLTTPATALSPEELEARFAALEAGNAPSAKASPPDDVEEELRALRKKVRLSD